ncbi:MAG: helix-turn-helix transcriptional regulator [Desulfuromonadales bacterium]|nr:helix-turn-helix transcriptional regulator [Desulfuromonadales bacterium]
MEKQLNIEKLEASMVERGLNQAALAKGLGVSRTIISDWLKGSKFPRPDKLLKLGMTLGLPFSELVIKSTLNEPIVAFRKKGGRKTKDTHFERAKDMGRLLESLTPYLPFSSLTHPPSLKNPHIEYEYIQEVVKSVRADIGISATEPIKFDNFIQKFKEFDVILIPVLWGRKDNHENALHIHLPESGTTWIYLNLDSNFHDFNFWMSHELGHVLSQKFQGEEAEDLADFFAQALLFPEECAEKLYNEINCIPNVGIRIRKIIEKADEYDISPITVMASINSFSKNRNFPEINLGNGIYAATTNFNKGFLNISDSLVKKGKKLTARDYIDAAQNVFKSQFFQILERFLSENEKSPGFIQNILQVDFVDARGIYKELTL